MKAMSLVRLVQYDLFEPPISEVEDMKRQLAEMKKSQDKVRKGIYAKHGELCKMYLDLYHEVETLKRDICRNRR